METSGKVNNCGIYSCQFAPQKVAQHAQVFGRTQVKGKKMKNLGIRFIVILFAN